MTDDREPLPAEGSGEPPSEPPAAPPSPWAARSGGPAPSGSAPTPRPDWATPPPDGTAATPPATTTPLGATPWPAEEPAADPTGPRRVLGIGSVLARTFDTFLGYPLPFILLAVPSAVLSLVVFQLGVDRVSLESFGITLIVDVIGVIFGLAIIVAADQARTTATVEVGPAMARALERTIVAILQLLVLILALLGVGIALAIVIGLTFLTRVSALVAVAAVAGAVVYAYILVRWLLAQAAVVLDGAGPIAALNRSWALTRGNVLRMVAIGLLISLIAFVPAFGVGLLALTMTDPIFAILAGAVVTLVATPLAGILIATIYGDLAGRPIAPPAKAPNTTARWILVGGLVVVGVVGAAVAIPNLGSALDRLAVAAIPSADRGTILFGTGRDATTDCRPTGTKTTFSTSEPIYIGGYFSKPVPAGQQATVAVYVNGAVAASAPVGDSAKPAICYYEADPVVGAQPGTYRIEITLAGETIASGQFVVQ